MKFLITMLWPMLVPKMVLLSCNMPWRCPRGTVIFVESHWSSYEIDQFVKGFFFQVFGIVSSSFFPQAIAHRRPPCERISIVEPFIIFYSFFLCVVKIALMTNHIKWSGNWVFFVDTTYIPNVECGNDFLEFIRPN